MIERYTIKFGPAVSQKELEKALHEDGDLSKAHHLKARIELIGEASMRVGIVLGIAHGPRSRSYENGLVPENIPPASSGWRAGPSHMAGDKLTSS